MAGSSSAKEFKIEAESHCVPKYARLSILIFLKELASFFSGEDFEKIEEEKAGRELKFEIRIESSSDEESYCDSMSYDGDKKLPA